MKHVNETNPFLLEQPASPSYSPQDIERPPGFPTHDMGGGCCHVIGQMENLEGLDHRKYNFLFTEEKEKDAKCQNGICKQIYNNR